MFNLFSPSKNTPSSEEADFRPSFPYLQKNDIYFDSACQTLRPQQVIAAETEYYQCFNACGHRVKYPWGKKVDDKVDECRRNLLKLVGKSEKEYSVAFCLNATHGVQLILHQLAADQFNSVTTTNIEHSSIFVPSIAWANKHNKKRHVIDRELDGSVSISKIPVEKTVFMANTMSNFDGQELENVAAIAQVVKKQGGIVLLDACQTMGHHPELLANVDFDAVFGSGHKMYGPSIGFVIVRKELLATLDYYMLGGSTIADNTIDSYEVIRTGDEAYSGIEAGLQNFAGIIGLNEAIMWKRNWRLKIEHPSIYAELKKDLNAGEYEQWLSEYLHTKLEDLNDINAITQQKKSVVSLISDKLDGHKFAMYLGSSGIMCRSGYHCCYYHLKHQKNYSPLLRISLGLHNTSKEIDQIVEKLEILLK